MEKLENQNDAPNERIEESTEEKLAGKKRLFRKNQIIITALAVMIAVAGYINYADSTLSENNNTTAEGVVDTNNSQVLQDIESLDYDISDEDMTASGSGETQTEDAGSVTETPGEAVLTGASTYMAQARIDREQVRSQNKEALNEIINNTNLSEAERQSAVQSLVEMTDLIEKETAAEQMLEAQGFSDVVVNLTGETADVVVPQTQVSDEQRAQIEDIVTRKAEIGVENIVITPMSETGEADGGSGSGEEGTDAASSETPTPETTETPEE